MIKYKDNLTPWLIDGKLMEILRRAHDTPTPIRVWIGETIQDRGKYERNILFHYYFEKPKSFRSHVGGEVVPKGVLTEPIYIMYGRPKDKVADPEQRKIKDSKAVVKFLRRSFGLTLADAKSVAFYALDAKKYTHSADSESGEDEEEEE